ncbi:MAG: LytTR family transcriptional regulator DNA-binding domain-containing protein [Lachnospiraceae bacterium]|nr:LytTR family transcriptional regulator DNA-binding domain-containing protein [Lachnospiraceae bacterium]
MIKAVLRNTPEDASLIEWAMKQETADTSDEMLRTVVLENAEMVKKCVDEREEWDFISVDVSDDEGIENAERLRAGYPSAAMVLVADVAQSPIKYMKPSIMAAGLILKPLNPGMVSSVIKQMFERFITKESSTDMLTVESREDKWRIPFSSIMYFEARMKKIYACTYTNEYGFYDTLDALIERLPDFFIRCHRGYVVNQNYVTKAAKAKGVLILKDDIEIPLSRSYKDSF